MDLIKIGDIINCVWRVSNDGEIFVRIASNYFLSNKVCFCISVVFLVQSYGLFYFAVLQASLQDFPNIGHSCACRCEILGFWGFRLYRSSGLHIL